MVSEKGSVTNIERARWVDWDQQGRLVFARDGRIFQCDIAPDGHNWRNIAISPVIRL